MAAQEVQAQLAAVLESTGGAAGVTAEQANTLADSLSKVTRFDDEMILSAESMMLTFTSITKDVFPDAIQAALDMSTAMGTDLNGSVLQIGKALQDPIAGLTALRRVGVQFTDAQEAMIKKMVEAGDTMGAQKFILAELTREFGGSAVAAGQTFAGQLDIMKTQLGNVKEQIGGALLPALTELLKQIGPGLVTAAGAAATFLTDKLIPALTVAGQWLGENVPRAIATLKGWWETLQPAMAVVGQFVTGSLIPALTTLGQWLGENLPPVIQAASDLWQNVLLPAIRTVWAFIQDPLMPIFVALADLFTSVIGVAVAALGAIWRTVLLPAIQGVHQFIQNNLLPVFEAVRAWAADTFPPILAAFGRVFDVVRDAVKGLWQFIAKNLLPVFETLRTKADELGEKYTWFRTFVLDPVRAAFESIRDAIGWVLDKFNALKGALDNFSLPGWIESLASRLDGIIQKLGRIGQGNSAGSGAGAGAGNAVTQGLGNVGMVNRAVGVRGGGYEAEKRIAITVNVQGDVREPEKTGRLVGIGIIQEFRAVGLA